MKKALLTLAAVGMMASANAQLLNYGFETSDFLPGALETVNWENYAEGSTFTFTSEDAYQGQYALGVSTATTANTWERVVAFKGIDIKPLTSYRVSFYVKGNGTVNVALMQGDWNRDITLVAGNGENFVEQKYDKAVSNTSYKRVSQVFWSPAFETQEQYYAKNHSDELLSEYFLRLAFTGIGNYSVDNVTIEEANVNGVVFNGDALCVDFGYATNGEKLANEAGGTAVFDPSCVTVKADGEVVEVESVEIKKDGKLYFFLTEENWLTNENVVTVSFTNTIGLQYANSTAPMCFETPNAEVYNFECVAEYDEDFEAISVAYEEAELVTSSPEDDSFELDPAINTFSFTYNKNVLTSYEGDKAVATLEGAAGAETLVLVESETACPTITFKRAEGAAPLARGQYSVKVENVYNEKGVAKGTADVITFDVGKVVVSETVYSLVAECTFPETEPNAIPEGWVVSSDGEVRTPGNTYGSGGRTFACGAPQQRGIYTRANGGEGSVTSPLVEIPAGDVEFRALINGWSSNSNVTLQLINAADEIVFENTFNTITPAENIRNNSDFKFDAVPFRFKHDGSAVKMYVKLNSEGFSGMFVGGFEVYTYSESDGEKDQSEVLVNGTFSDVNGNFIPAAGSGWRIWRNGTMRTPGANGGWGGNDVTGGGGPRMFDLAYKNLTKGVYVDGTTSLLTYGEFLTYDVTDDEGNTTTMDEQIFKLGAQKIQITYYSALWKADGIHLYFEIIKQENGHDGTPVYSRVDVIDTKSPQGIANDNSVEAMKTQFTWVCPEAGNYIMKFYTDGEGFVGNIKVETVASLAVQCKNLLKAALVEAQEELDAANSKDEYAGTTRDLLAQKIQDYTNPDFHSKREYDEAIADLADIVKKMAARRRNMDSYPTSLQSLADGLAAAEGTKNENLEEYALVKSNYEEYKDVDPMTLSDEALAEAVEKMGNLGTLLKNMCETCVPLLTQQISELASAIVNLDENYFENGAIIAADNALTDNQHLVQGLKLLYDGLLYKKLATENPFQQYDEEIDMYFADSLEMHFMIQNRNMYTDAQKQKTGALANENSFAGWNIEIVQNSILADWGWGGPYKCSETCPISEAAICTAWGTSEINVSQTIAGLPAGKYTVAIGVADGTSTNDENLSFAFAVTAAKADTAIVANDNGARSLVSYQFNNMVADLEGNTSSLTVGAGLRSRGDFSKADEAKLWMTGKAEGFDYASAADALLQEFAEGIQLQERDDQPAQVYYFDLNGRRIADAQGVCISIARYADGYTVVRKVVVK